MKYRLYFPTPNERGSTMMDHTYETPRDRSYEVVYEGTVDAPATPMSLPIVVESLWLRHNEGDNRDGNRPRRKEIRSMCIGDIIVFDGTPAVAFVAEQAGFSRLGVEDIPMGLEKEFPSHGETSL